MPSEAPEAVTITMFDSDRSFTLARVRRLADTQFAVCRDCKREFSIFERGYRIPIGQRIAIHSHQRADGTWEKSGGVKRAWLYGDWSLVMEAAARWTTRRDEDGLFIVEQTPYADVVVARVESFTGPDSAEAKQKGALLAAAPAMLAALEVVKATMPLGTSGAASVMDVVLAAVALARGEVARP